MRRWYPVKPNRVRRSFRDHPWIFAYYFESPDERDDGMWYHALLFRDRDRTEFGALEFVDGEVTVPVFHRQHDLRAIASRIVTDSAYRNSLLQDSPRLRELWRRR